MTQLTKGGNAAINGTNVTVDIDLKGIAQFDIVALGVKGDGKIYAPSAKEYIVLFNQAETTDGAIKLQEGNKFAFDLSKVPADVDKIVIAASLAEGSGKTMGDLTTGQIAVSGGVSYTISRQEISGKETSLILGELYRRQGAWKFRAVGQGFNDGFAALLKSYGVVVDDAPAAPAPAAAPAAQKVSLQKQRLEKLEKAGHPLVSLAKKASVSLEKAGLGDLPAAEVVCVMDTSGSMHGLYTHGVVQKITERVLAAAAVLDDDGKVPMIGFDEYAKRLTDIDLTNFKGHIQRVIGDSLGGGTAYAPAIELTRDLKDGESWVKNGPVKTGKMPRIVLFVTDGDAQDQEAARRMIREASREPIFFVFVGVGNNASFSFLNELDSLKGRYLDNASTMFIKDMAKLTDEELYAMLTKELPAWLKQAKEFGLLSDNPKGVSSDATLMAKIKAQDDKAKKEVGTSAPKPRFGW